MKKILSFFMVLGLSTIFLGCQSQPKPLAKATIKSNSSLPASLTTQVTVRTIPLIKSKDGVQDIRWVIHQINHKKANVFNEMPYVLLNSANQRFQGHTGCNAVYGTYQFNDASKALKLNLNAGYTSCNGALSQEADLMDALSRTEFVQTNGKNLQLLDKNKSILIQAEQR